jgi:ATP-dependent RNA helicase DDX3X
MADRLDQILFENDFPVTSIHGDRTQAEREDALLAFKMGKAPIMVATAVIMCHFFVTRIINIVAVLLGCIERLGYPQRSPRYQFRPL